MNPICITKEKCGIVASQHLISRSNGEWPTKWNGMRMRMWNMEYGMAIGMEFKMGKHKYLHISLSTSKTFSMRVGAKGKCGKIQKGECWVWAKTMADDKLLHMLTKLGSYSYFTAAPIQKELKLAQTKLNHGKQSGNGRAAIFVIALAAIFNGHSQYTSQCACVCVCV